MKYLVSRQVAINSQTAHIPVIKSYLLVALQPSMHVFTIQVPIGYFYVLACIRAVSGFPGDPMSSSVTGHL